VKSNSDNSGLPSRRQFTKSVVAATIAVPIVASMTACPKPPTSNPCTCPDPSEGEPVKCEFRMPGLETEPHEPPITVTSGSFKLDLNRAFRPPERTGSTDRPWRYKLAEEYYTEINRVQVLTERDHNISTDYYYLNFRQAYLGIWLQKNTAAANQTPVWSPFTVEPQILFMFYRNGDYNLFALETDQELTPSRFKRLRPYRYEHPEYPQTQAFRLAKWSLFYPTPANVITVGGTRFEDDLTTEGTTSEGFQLGVTFEHKESYRKRHNLSAAS